ncbi:MAG: TrbI/VirB10 family protein [Leptolyngbyaceae cyanobacterium bins.302]|nr:TrbI/VirB10 family protein [Leptolyngbyaceae cyanobacterium bins.302]
MLRNPSTKLSSNETQSEDIQNNHLDEWGELAAMTGFVPEPPPGKVKARSLITSPTSEPQFEAIIDTTEEPDKVSLLDDEDLRESEETAAKTKTPLWSDPFAKGAFVSMLMAIAVGSVGLLLWSINGNWKPPTQSSQVSVPEPEATPVVDPEQAEIGRLKTVAALSTQAQTMQQDTVPVPTSPDVMPTAQPDRSARPTSAARTEAPSPSIAYTPPRSYTPVVRPVSPPVALAQSTPTVPQAPVEPTQAWQQALAAGSYGQVNNSSIPQAAETVVTPPAEPDQTAIASSSEATQLISNEQTRFDTDVTAILSGVPSHTLSIRPGTTTTATLSTPIMWAQDLEDDEQPQRFGLQLAEPLLAAGGTVAFPAGTQMIARVNTIAESGMVQLEIVAAVAPDTQGSELIHIPTGSILIAGEDGKPLMAENYNPDRHRIARMDAQIALMGALGQVGALLNRPENESTTTSPYLSSTSITNGRSNILGGLLQGGFNALLGQTQQRQQQEIQTILQRPRIWFVPAGQPVQVFVNSSFQVSL